MDTTIPVLAPKSVNLSIDTDPGSSKTDNHSESGGDSTDDGSRSTDSNTTNTNASIHASIDTDTDSISKPASPSIGYGSKVTEPPVGNDNVASDVVGTVKPSQTNTALLKDQNIAPEENGSTLGTNSGSASKSSWSGERITTVISTICGTGVVAAIAVFVAIRRGQSKKIMEIRTPTDDYANDGTPTNFGGHGATYYSGGNHTVDSFAHTPLAAIAVIGSDDAFLNSPSSESKHQYRSYAGAERNASEDYYACTDSHKDVVVRPSSTAIQPQFLASNDPSISDLLSPTSDPIFDTTYSRESFSSDMSSQSESPSDELFRESDLSFDSFRVTCETSRGTDHDSNSSTHSRNRQASSDFKENVAGSSVSSLDSVQYDFRDTKVSENMRELEMETGSSRIAISFDMDSYDSKGL
ncbi:unnamed protein product [Peronospora farinosa]|uniref:Uncharacterized protein n=1 Tax=Peronospora farinosa TaxID=134698 RepID=A0AAV0TZB3_9STRA|nr:unnamed protein product [Peronospora farinosa]